MISKGKIRSEVAPGNFLRGIEQKFCHFGAFLIYAYHKFQFLIYLSQNDFISDSFLTLTK